MFCPSAVDYGNVADWVAGIGTLVAVGVAIRIAGTERRSVEAQRTIDGNVAFERRAQVKAEAIRLIGQAQSIATLYAAFVKIGGSGGQQRKIDTIDGIAGVRAQLLALQQFPQSDPRLYAAIGRAAFETMSDADTISKSPTFVQSVMETMVSRLSSQQTAIASL